MSNICGLCRAYMQDGIPGVVALSPETYVGMNVFMLTEAITSTVLSHQEGGCP